MMNEKVKIFGFTLLRNGVKYDYSFKESLLSLAPLCQKIYLALGESEDTTQDELSSFPFLHIIPTIWDESLREGGLILSEQTNVALNELRKDHGDNPNAWGIYLQADEVFHEEDYELIKKDIQRANEQGCDVIRFRYLHFWQTHHDIAINKKWYPQEIRAVRLNTNIQSWGDAQSFKNFKKTYESEAKIFHYGHVREKNSYQKKKADILKLYHKDSIINKYKRREKRFDNQTKCLPFFGSHPRVMRERIDRLGDIWTLNPVDRIDIVGDPYLYSTSLIEKIKAKEIHWHKSLKDVPKIYRKRAIITKPNCWQKLYYQIKTPEKMESKLARKWSNDFRLILQLSEKMVGMRGQKSEQQK